MEQNQITISEIKAAIERSGYLIEQRVSEKLEQNSYNVNPNQIIVDPITEVRREIDLVAIDMIYDYENRDNYGYELICECENNHLPIVFFTSELDPHKYLSELRCSGFKEMWTYFRDSSKLFPASTTLVSTQYCSFHKTKKRGEREEKWIALHQDAQHNTFDKLKKSVQHRIPKFEPTKDSKKQIEGRIHYPLMVLKGDLLSWDSKRANDPISKVNHVIYRMQDFNAEKNLYENYYIDVIVEEYLDEYVALKRREWDHLNQIIKSNRSKILKAKAQRFWTHRRNIMQ